MPASPSSTVVKDDLVTVLVVGSLSLSDSQSIYGQIGEVLAERGYVLALFDLSRAAVPAQESRKWISHWFRDHDVTRIAVATFGTSLLVRTVNRMFDSAVHLLTGKPSPARHFSTAAEARAWLQERQRVFRGGTKA
jgi:hypothetical protein